MPCLRRSTDDGEEVIRQEREEARPGRKSHVDGKARRAGAGEDRIGIVVVEAEIRAGRRALVEAISARLIASALAVALLLVAALPAAATTVVAKRFSDLCAEADLVFAGTVTATASDWSDSSKRAIETRVTFADLTWLRGTPRGDVTLRFAGGTVDGLTEEIAGVPRFAVGDRVVIFARDGEFISPIVGFHQGLYRVIDGAVIDADGQPVTHIGGAALRRGSAPDAPAAPLSLEQFLDGVRSELSRP
jgi:hypothetical protein